MKITYHIYFIISVLFISSCVTDVTENDRYNRSAELIKELGQSTFQYVHFFNENEGVLIIDSFINEGLYGTICKTYDGAKSFESKFISDRSLEWNYATFYDGQKGFIASDNRLIGTEDSGETWKEYFAFEEQEYINAIQCLDNDIILIIINRKKIYRSTDNGNSFELILAFGYNDNDLMFFDKASDKLLFIMGQSGTIYRSMDNGLSWHLRVKPTMDRIVGSHLLNEHTGFVISQNRLFKTSDGGDNWELLYEGGSHNFQMVHFIDEEIGFIAKKEGVINRTMNFGSDFSGLIYLGTNYYDQIGIQFINESTGFIYGGQKLYKYF